MFHSYNDTLKCYNKLTKTWQRGNYSRGSSLIKPTQETRLALTRLHPFKLALFGKSAIEAHNRHCFTTKPTKLASFFAKRFSSLMLQTQLAHIGPIDPKSAESSKVNNIFTYKHSRTLKNNNNNNNTPHR